MLRSECWRLKFNDLRKQLKFSRERERERDETVRFLSKSLEDYGML